MQSFHLISNTSYTNKNKNYTTGCGEYYFHLWKWVRKNSSGKFAKYVIDAEPSSNF